MGKKITLNIEDKLWLEFKDIVPSSISLNEAIVQLIESKINENKKEVLK